MGDVRIIASARKHGIADADILHALRNPLRFVADDRLVVVIGAAQNGMVLEIGVVEDESEDRVVHAMPARAKYWP